MESAKKQIALVTGAGRCEEIIWTIKSGLWENVSIGLKMWLGRTAVSVVLIFFAGCSQMPAEHLPVAQGEATAIQEARKRKDEIIYLSSPEMDSRKPVLLLLHGATDDPLEMMGIVRKWRSQYNVLLYAYNFHHPIGKIAAHLVCEMKKLHARMEVEKISMQNMTVVTYSYSALVFRKAVLLADDPTMLSSVSLIQLVPTAGGSYLARGMKNPLANFLTSLASNFSAAENPFGSIAEELWGEEGSRKFYEVIHRARMHSILIEGDPHSLANSQDEEIQRRYLNAIGTNVIVIPKSVGATHEYFPTEPVALEYLRKVLEAASAAAANTIPGSTELKAD